MFDNNNGSPVSATECYDGFANDFGVTYGYYHGGAAPFTVPFTPFDAFINLKTGIVVEKDSMSAYFESAQEVITLMEEAAN